MINLPLSLTKSLSFVLNNHMDALCVSTFFVIPSCVLSAYEHHRRCSQPFNCGYQGGLLYPFWIPGRKDCGHPDFELDCSRRVAELILSSVKYRILEVNYDSRMVRLARSDYIDNLCPPNPPNAPFFKSLLPFAPDTELITTYYACQNLSSFSYFPKVTELVCMHEKEGRTNYYVTRNISSLLLDDNNGLLFDKLRENCTVSGSALNTLREDNLTEILEQGFELGLNQDCTMCIESKGACGYNQTSREFVCYCNDGTHGLNCGSGKRSHGKPLSLL